MNSANGDLNAAIEASFNFEQPQVEEPNGQEEADDGFVRIGTDIGTDTSSDALYTCKICFEPEKQDFRLLSNCVHVICSDCLGKIAKSRNVTCPFCSKKLKLADCRKVVLM